MALALAPPVDLGCPLRRLIGAIAVSFDHRVSASLAAHTTHARPAGSAQKPTTNQHQQDLDELKLGKDVMTYVKYEDLMQAPVQVNTCSSQAGWMDGWVDGWIMIQR